MFANISLKWFALYYPLLGFVLFFSGMTLMIKTEKFCKHLKDRAPNEHPPALLRSILKYFFLFTIPCLLFSLFPFSWVELLFSIWSLVIVYVAGIQLVRWPQTRKLIRKDTDKTRSVIFKTGAIMLAVSPVMFLLSYITIRKLIS